MSKWVNCELPKETAGRFKEYCRDMHIRYEASECEIAKANAFIDERC